MYENPPKGIRWRFLRDLVILALGSFMLIYETLSMTPNPEIIAAALVLLGLPPVLRLDARRNGD